MEKKWTLTELEGNLCVMLFLTERERERERARWQLSEENHVSVEEESVDEFNHR